MQDFYDIYTLLEITKGDDWNWYVTGYNDRFHVEYVFHWFKCQTIYCDDKIYRIEEVSTSPLHNYIIFFHSIRSSNP